jgi:adenylate kinase
MIYFSKCLGIIMMVSITGTPGCGKTSAAQVLKGRGYSVKAVNLLAEEANCVADYDKEMDSKEIDLEKLNDYVAKNLKGEDNIIEGHLSHLLSVDKVIILRCDPLILRKRLEEKGWNDSKIKENVEAEILDVIKVEVYEEEHKIHEIDTTLKNPHDVADDIEKIINGDCEDTNVDWLEKYEYILFE